MSSSQKLQCPACRRMFEPQLDSQQMPFCSVRCKMADLNRWFEEDVVIPISSLPEDEEDSEPPAPPQQREWKFD